MKETLFVGGSFNQQGGKPSSVMNTLCVGFHDNFKGKIHKLNGGNIEDLSLLDFKEYDVILWFPDIPNEMNKIIQSIKQINPSCVLVTSKRNFNEYSRAEVIQRALKIKSNLVVEVNQNEVMQYVGCLIDPLGNIFQDFTNDFYAVGKALGKRIKELQSFTRMPSEKIDGTIEVPDEKRFFEIIRQAAETFHSLLPEVKTERFLGNASFRCARGFPSMRKDDIIFVSRRNVDKRFIDREAFVPVQLRTDKVCYYGEHKPSVDTPIQLKIYDYFPNIRYMIHGHVHIKGGPFTKHIIPCGALEEFDDVRRIVQDKDIHHFAINLKGHGFIVASDQLEFLCGILYNERKI